MELKDTVDLMLSEDYKERYIAEWLQTKIRYSKLHKMLFLHRTGKLQFTPKCDIKLLEDQSSAMYNYLCKLEIRAAVEKIDLPQYE